MENVKAKKYLGQHFLTDKNIAEKIANSLQYQGNVLEIGPGMGILTDFILQNPKLHVAAIEIDHESVDYLHERFPNLTLYQEDFLKFDIHQIFNEPFAIIGNFPYNISAPILFKLLEMRDIIPELTGMFQKEVAQRICTKAGSKEYGILSVLLQTFFHCDYLFMVHEGVFNPPPKVKSAVIRLTRKENFRLSCNEKLYFQVVKAAFNQRRKTMRNSLKSFAGIEKVDEITLQKRPEQLSFDEFITLVQKIES
ncbi:MAG: 16S rRNA (adenine(1518)-N(6)/adenine(1519)-N(6))-dimethyltransferase RsmA [Bacteroidales bacterium]|nr:16S rRNA (adenine(1518)-N(6)/adenine(1519)-N(6))-dimethyltransferase RsmA [Bacteroidales bacterium]